MKASVFVTAMWLCITAAWGLTPEEQQRFADGLYTRKLHEMAIKEYNRIIQEFPGYEKNDLVLYRAGECARRMGQAEQAMGYYSQIEKVFPKSSLVPRTRLRQAELHVQRAEYGNAIILLKKLQGAEISPEISAASLYYQGYSYSKLQQFDKGNALFDTLIKDHPASPFSAYAALEKAKNLSQKKGSGTADELIALFKKAASQPPSERAGAEAQLALADQLYRAGQFKESSEAFLVLYNKYGKYESVQNASLNAAWAHYNAGEHQRCLDRVLQTEASVRSAKAPDWIYLEANCYRHLKRDADALKKYKELVSAHTASSYADFAAYEIALVSFAAKDYATVLQQAERMLGQPKLKEDGLWLIAESNRELNIPETAITYYQRIVGEYPTSQRAPESLYKTATLHQKLQRPKEAAAQYRLVSARYGAHELAPRSLFAAGYCAVLSENHAQAVKDWAALVKAYPDHELVNESLYQKGLAEMHLKQEKPAVATFKQLLARNPQTRIASEAAYWCAVMLERQKQPAEAEILLKQALAKSPREDLVPQMQYRLAMVLQKQNKMTESAEFLQILAEKQGARILDPALLDWLVRHRWEEKAYERALPAARRLTAVDVEEKWRQMGWGLLGLTLEKLGKDKEAAMAYLKGLEMGSRTEEVVHGALFVGHYHFKEKQYDAAIKDYESTAAIASEVGMLEVQVKAYYGLGIVGEATENWEDASRYFMSVAVLFDDPMLSPESLYRAASAFEKLGRTKEQNQAIKELAERYPNSEWATKDGT